MRRTPIACGFFLLLAALSAQAQDAPKPSERPNVLFIVVDDLRCSLGCYGDDAVRSPNIDRLAAKGVRFDRAYCQYPVCNPSRTSFLTGLRPDHTGILENQTPFRVKMPDVVTLPELYRQAGYHTIGLGKIFHAGIDTQGHRVLFQDPRSWADCRNFDPTPTGRRGEGRNLTGGTLKWCSWLAAEGGDEDQSDGRNAAAALEALAETHDRPFFLAVGFHKPHDPFNAPAGYFTLYPPDAIALHRPPSDRTPDVPLAVPNKANFATFTDRERREFQRAYYAGISFTDAQVGKLLDALDRRKLWDRTIVVLVGDHGYHLGDHEWWNKVTLFEGGTRVPFIVWAPGAGGWARGSPPPGSSSWSICIRPSPRWAA